MPLDPVTGLPQSILAADARRKRGQALATAAQDASEARRRKGQNLASQYSGWANEQERERRSKDAADIDAATDAAGEDDWLDQPTRASQERKEQDWLKRLGVKMPERNPMLSADRLPERMYGYDTSGSETLGMNDVLDLRRPRQQRQQRAGGEEQLTPEMAQALAAGNVTAPRPESPVAAMYDLGPGRAGEVAQVEQLQPVASNDETLRRIWGLG